MIGAKYGNPKRDLFVALINEHPWRVARTGIRVIGVNLTQRETKFSSG